VCLIFSRPESAPALLEVLAETEFGYFRTSSRPWLS
jgi:hypothetical protein